MTPLPDFPRQGILIEVTDPEGHIEPFVVWSMEDALYFFGQGFSFEARSFELVNT